MRRRSTAASIALLALAGSLTLAQDPTQRRGFAVEIKAPENQELVYGKTKIEAKVKIDDPARLDRVEFLVGDEVIFVDRESPYECFYDFGEGERSFIVRAVAYHKEGVSVSDAIITRKLGFSMFERVNRVILWLSATDKSDRFVAGLSKEDFRILEEGAPQEVLEFYREERPITLAILLDSSGSMQDKIKEVHEAAGGFVETLRDEDRALVIDFDDRVFLIQDLTSDHDALKEAIASTEPIGATSIYDALHAAYRKIGSVEGRKAFILLSDGEDTSSQFGFKRVLEEAKSNSTMIYGIAIGGGDRSKLKEFSEVTGGRFFAVNKAAELNDVYRKIAEELRAQYYVTYSTTNSEWDGRFIEIDVESLRSDVKLRARRGYFAVRPRGR